MFKNLLIKDKYMRERFRLPWNIEDSVTALTASYMAEVELRHRDYIPDVHTEKHIRQAAQWLTAERPKFGMLLCGQCGNGKTTLALAIRGLVSYLSKGNYNQDAPCIHMTDAKEICAFAKEDYKTFKALCRRNMLAIDDLGTEPAEVLDYGNVLNPAIDLLSARYTDQLFTIVTTNLTPKQIREHYGDRIADRFNEMFERIIFDNPTYRN